ncbi:protein AF-10 isoform X2 [Wyeomyia smithii]|uniref:protein AF-10 isoform X2 n=1 Tax=Wyeomyia smithii TaxID=174621 RepID=UPI002467FFDF|nr:protein AF-10 isoform X2 [Wyeomyia smithii]
MKEMVGGCCVCSDDRGWSENPLVYCDGQSCAVAVHQACYGIVTVPSGPWYCRKCESQERSARVRCELCPSRDGALKRTDNQGWAHVVCALYIPEVRFGNVTTMEPIILQLIPQERYNKTCYICQEMGKGSRSTAGACMQCNKSGCKQQFHVTCAQQLGLLCEEAGNYLDNVKYCGYCQHHYSKLKKGGNVKTIPPYKPISHETNSSDGPSSPEKELEPLAVSQHSTSGSVSATGNTSNSMKSNNRQMLDQSGSSASSSSKQRKSSSVSKGTISSSSTLSTSTFVTASTSGPNIASSSPTSVPIGLTSGSNSGSSAGGNANKVISSSSSSNSSSNKEKDKYSKSVNKVSSTNKNHEKETSSGSSATSSSSQRDKGSKSSKSGSNNNSGGSSNISTMGSLPGNPLSANSNIGGSLTKDNELSPLTSSIQSGSTMSSATTKNQDGTVNKPEKTLAQISSAAVSSARAASLSPAAIPTTLIIKPPHDHSGNTKEILSKDAIAKFTTSNFTETIVVNSDSVFGSAATTGNSSSGASSTQPNNAAGNINSSVGTISVIESSNASSTAGIANKINISGGNTSSSTGPGATKKRKADARSTPTSTASSDIDITRDLIKDVAVSLVPLPLNKSDNIDPASLLSIEKNIKKAKTEPNSPHNPSGEINIQNVSPNLVQSHASNVISSSIKHQQQSNSPQLQQQQQGQQHTPSLVVSVPLSTATVPGINLPTSNSNSSSGTGTSITANNASSNSSSSSTPNIISTSQMSSGSSLYQQLTHRTNDQIANATSNRSSPIIQQQQSNMASHVIQNSAHIMLERHSPSMRSSPAIITSAGSQQQQSNLFSSGGGMDLNLAGLTSGVSVLQSISPVPMSTIQSTSSSPIIPGNGGDGGLKISYEKQTSNVRISALQDEKLSGRRSRSKSRERGGGGGGSGNGSSVGGGKTRTSKKRSLQHQQLLRSSPLVNTGSSSSSSSSSANNALFANEPTTTSRSSTPSNSHSNANNNNQPNLTLNSSSSNTSRTNPANGNTSNSLLINSTGTSIVGPSTQSHSDKLSQSASSASYSSTAIANVSNSSSASTVTIAAASGTPVIETIGSVSTSSNSFQSNHPGGSGGQSHHITVGTGSIASGNSISSNHSGSNIKNNSSNLIAGTGTDHGHGTPSSNNTSSNSNNNNAMVVTHTSKKLRSSQPMVEIPSPSNSRTPDNSYVSNSFTGSSGGGLKFSYEAQPSNPAAIGATATIITPQTMVKESPPSSPGSDTGMTRCNKRNRKLSTNSNAGISAPHEAKEIKLFQNGVVHATHMLGNQLNPNSSVAQKMSDQLTMEMESHTFVEAAPQLVGPPFPGKIQASRTHNAAATGGPSLTSMLTGSGTATANGNTPQSLEQLLERQWEQGSQFLMEQAQHFDIASLLSCLHQLRSENIRLEEHVNNLVARRDHLLAVNARLAIPLNPTALGGVGLTVSNPGGPGTTATSSTGSGNTNPAGSQAQFNNMHGNGPHETSGSTSNTTTISSRSSRIQQHQTQQQQQPQSHFGSSTVNQIPLENGIDFRHSSSTHQSSNSSSIRQTHSSSSGVSDQGTGHSRSGRGNNSSSSSSSNSSNTNPASSSAYQQTIYNTAHQIPLLLEHHQQEHHSQQQLQQQTQSPQVHHHRQASPTVASRSHHSSLHSARSTGAAPQTSHSHHLPLSHQHPSSLVVTATPAHAQPTQQQQHQQSLPQRQRH